MLKGHGGNIYDLAQQLGCHPSDIVDMSSNMNPLGPPEDLVDLLQENIKTMATLPEVDANRTVNMFAGRYDIDPERVIAGNGTTQFIYSIPRLLETKKALIFGPTYADYADACAMHHIPYDYSNSEESVDFEHDIKAAAQQIQDYDTVFICNPNNPTGNIIPTSDLEHLCKSHADVNFVIDESYLMFIDGSNKQSMIRSTLPNVMVLNSMSKFFTIPGLRIGFLISSPVVIKKFKTYLLPWSVNSLAQMAVQYLMRQTTQVEKFIKNTVSFIARERDILFETFKNSSAIKLFPSNTSFILARLYGNLTADGLGNHRILIRNCANFNGLSDRFVRFSLKTSEINRMFAKKLLARISQEESAGKDEEKMKKQTYDL
ncbi:MAG: pyridoxal phosphate-dependent class II aminotransferase [Deltaproteobacteria bacterium]|nr:pyridoxal phosphate-dependent class II aminotransferase [Deltaproteobacteria bacterium]